MVKECEKANSQRAPGHFHSAQLHVQTLHSSKIRNAVSPCHGKIFLLLNNNIKSLWLL